MKRILTLSFLLLLIDLASIAQTIVYQQDFNSNGAYYPIPGWTAVNYNGPVNWQCGYPYTVGGQCFTPPPGNNTTKIVGITDRHSFQGGPCNVNNNLSHVFVYTNSINLSNVQGAWLKFDVWFKKETSNNISEGAYVDVSTNNATSWTHLFNIPGYTPGFKTYYVDLAAYDHAADFRIGLRYSDSGALRSGIMFDNVRVFVPAQKDLELLQILPEDSLKRFKEVNEVFFVRGRVRNAGVDTVHSFNVYFKRDNGPVQSELVSGVSIPAFGYYDFQLNTPDMLTAPGPSELKMWVGFAGDTIKQNDSARATYQGVYFTPHKKLVIEEGTGTWNMWCPRGWVMMHDIGNDHDPIRISVHDGDSMQVPVYKDFMYNLRYNFVPYFVFDRRENVPYELFYDRFIEQEQYFGFADIHVSASYNGNTVHVASDLTPAIDLSGDHRIVLVLTEDGVKKNATGYAQANAFANNANGPMGGFETKPDPVPAQDMIYDFVARAISPAPDGQAQSLPSFMAHNTTYYYDQDIQLDPSWDKTKLTAIAMLVRNSDSAILNAARQLIPTAVVNVNKTELEARLYPNPASAQTSVYFELNSPQQISITVSDLTGRVVYELPGADMQAGRHQVVIPVAQFVAGIYLVNIQSGSGRAGMKLQVLH